MTKRDIVRKMNADFTSAEFNQLGSKPMTTVQNMAKSDRILIDFELLDYLRDFFNGIYDGEPVPQVFSEVLIELKDQVGNLYRLYVTFPKEKPDWVYIDIFYAWKFLGKILFPNVKMDDSERLENGQFWGNTTFLSYEQHPQALLEVLLPAAKDVFMYAFLYVQANKEVKNIYKKEVVKSSSDSKPKNGKGGNGKKNKNSKDSMERDNVYVPTRRIYRVCRSEETEKRLCEYVYSRWKVRGYSYTRKDGRVINVKEHYKFRHLPNKGIDKEGKNFILRKADGDVTE